MKTLLTLLLTCLCITSTAQAKYSGGTGEANDPYQIATAADLIALGETPDDYDKHFILVADIDLDPHLPGRKVLDKAVIASAFATSTYPSPPYAQGTPFTGVFDGNAHRISHLTIKGQGFLGLFGQLASGAVVKDLGVVDVNTSGSGSWVGGLLGYNTGTVTQCYSTGTVKGHDCVGGLVGWNGGTLTLSYGTSAVDGNDCVGGLVGVNDSLVIRCYSIGAVRGSQDIGGLAGLNGHTLTQCYSTGLVSATGKDVGGMVGWDRRIMSSLARPQWPGTANACFWDTQTSGQVTSAGGVGKTTAEMRDPNMFWAAGWDFAGLPDGPDDIWAEPEGGGYPILWWQVSRLPELPTYSGGIGEPDDPYLISTAEDLNGIGHNPRLMNCHFMLLKNLDLTGLRFHPIGGPGSPYAGVFEGNGHTVSHLTITGGSYLGLFGQLASGAEVKNLGVVDVNIGGSGTFVSGLVGYNWAGTVTQCYSTGEVTGGGYVGGVVGFNWAGRVTQCYSAAEVTGKGYFVGTLVRGNVGGLVGENDGGYVTQCYSTGSVSGDEDVGGLVGYNLKGTVTQSYSTGAVSGGSKVGGLVGYNSGPVTQCYSTGAVNGKWPSVGGLVGRMVLGTYGPGTATSSFWDTQTSGQTKSDGGTGKTTAEMQTAGTFLETAWDFVDETANGTADIWWILEGKDYPRLWWEAAKK